MKTKVAALAVGALMLVGGNALAQKPTSAERGLLGINLYDPGKKVIARYGTPDEIQAVNVGGGGTMGGNGAPGFGGASGPPGFGGPGGRMGPPGGGGGAPSAASDQRNPFAFGNDLLQMGLGAPGNPGKGNRGGAGGGAPSMGGPSGPPGFGGPGGPPGFPGGAGMPGAPGGGTTPGRGFGGAAEEATFTRWVYNRKGSRYGFVLDKFNRVVQIEAIGITNPAVKTRRGLGFGATFAQVIKTYNAPDGYEIAGDNITVKYLNRAKVAFRLSRLGEKKPQVVTGVVVAAAKG